MMIQEIAPSVLKNAYEPARTAEKTDLFLSYRGNDFFTEKNKENLRVLTVGEAEALKGEPLTLTFLFLIDDRAFFTDLTWEVPETEQFGYLNKQKLRTMGPRDLAYGILVGGHIVNWYRNNVFCGKCGSKMIHSKKERALVCPDCGNTVYPRINPSVIVGVTDGDRLLLTKYAAVHLPYAHYALVAGFIEIGETPEEAVAREVMEEVGLKVKNIRYYKSQPWPFSDSLLLGYFCDLDGSDEIRLDESELGEGVFLHRSEIPERKDLVSLTSEMIQIFKEGNE